MLAAAALAPQARASHIPPYLAPPLQSVPSIDMPLHTVMELTPKADGTMAETRFVVDVDKAIEDAQRGLLHGTGARRRAERGC